MNARKQISIEQLFRLYPQLRLEKVEDAEQSGEKHYNSDTRSGHVSGTLAREHCMEV